MEKRITRGQTRGLTKEAQSLRLQLAPSTTSNLFNLVDPEKRKASNKKITNVPDSDCMILDSNPSQFQEQQEKLPLSSHTMYQRQHLNSTHKDGDWLIDDGENARKQRNSSFKVDTQKRSNKNQLDQEFLDLINNSVFEQETHAQVRCDQGDSEMHDLSKPQSCQSEENNQSEFNFAPGTISKGMSQTETEQPEKEITNYMKTNKRTLTTGGTVITLANQQSTSVEIKSSLLKVPNFPHSKTIQISPNKLSSRKKNGEDKTTEIRIKATSRKLSEIEESSNLNQVKGKDGVRINIKTKTLSPTPKSEKSEDIAKPERIVLKTPDKFKQTPVQIKIKSSALQENTESLLQTPLDPSQEKKTTSKVFLQIKNLPKTKPFQETEKDAQSSQQNMEALTISQQADNKDAVMVEISEAEAFSNFILGMTKLQHLASIEAQNNHQAKNKEASTCEGKQLLQQTSISVSQKESQTINAPFHKGQLLIDLYVTTSQYLLSKLTQLPPDEQMKKIEILEDSLLHKAYLTILQSQSQPINQEVLEGVNFANIGPENQPQEIDPALMKELENIDPIQLEQLQQKLLVIREISPQLFEEYCSNPNSIQELLKTEPLVEPNQPNLDLQPQLQLDDIQLQNLVSLLNAEGITQDDVIMQLIGQQQFQKQAEKQQEELAFLNQEAFQQMQSDPLLIHKQTHILQNEIISVIEMILVLVQSDPESMQPVLEKEIQPDQLLKFKNEFNEMQNELTLQLSQLDQILDAYEKMTMEEKNLWFQNGLVNYHGLFQTAEQFQKLRETLTHHLFQNSKTDVQIQLHNLLEQQHLQNQEDNMVQIAHFNQIQQTYLQKKQQRNPEEEEENQKFPIEVQELLLQYLNELQNLQQTGLHEGEDVDMAGNQEGGNNQQQQEVLEKILKLQDCLKSCINQSDLFDQLAPLIQQSSGMAPIRETSLSQPQPTALNSAPNNEQEQDVIMAGTDNQQLNEIKEAPQTQIDLGQSSLKKDVLLNQDAQQIQEGARIFENGQPSFNRQNMHIDYNDVQNSLQQVNLQVNPVTTQQVNLQLSTYPSQDDATKQIQADSRANNQNYQSCEIKETQEEKQINKQVSPFKGFQKSPRLAHTKKPFKIESVDDANLQQIIEILETMENDYILQFHLDKIKKLRDIFKLGKNQNQRTQAKQQLEEYIKSLQNLNFFQMDQDQPFSSKQTIIPQNESQPQFQSNAIEPSQMITFQNPACPSTQAFNNPYNQTEQQIQEVSLQQMTKQQSQMPQQFQNALMISQTQLGKQQPQQQQYQYPQQTMIQTEATNGGQLDQHQFDQLNLLYQTTKINEEDLFEKLRKNSKEQEELQQLIKNNVFSGQNADMLIKILQLIEVLKENHQQLQSQIEQVQAQTNTLNVLVHQQQQYNQQHAQFSQMQMQPMPSYSQTNNNTNQNQTNIQQPVGTQPMEYSNSQSQNPQMQKQMQLGNQTPSLYQQASVASAGMMSHHQTTLTQLQPLQMSIAQQEMLVRTRTSPGLPPHDYSHQNSLSLHSQQHPQNQSQQFGEGQRNNLRAGNDTHLQIAHLIQRDKNAQENLTPNKPSLGQVPPNHSN